MAVIFDNKQYQGFLIGGSQDIFCSMNLFILDFIPWKEEEEITW